jgi:hypothetical protein
MTKSVNTAKTGDDNGVQGLEHANTQKRVEAHKQCE